MNNSGLVKDEIDLRELILVIWRHKFIIISISLVAAILTGIYSFFMLSPIYHTNLNIVLSMPEIYQTKFGDYKLPITTNKEYINLLTSNNVLLNTIKDLGYDNNEVSIEALRERISIQIDTTNKEQNIFKIRVAAGNPQDAKKLADALYNNYIEFINVSTVESAINSYYNRFNVNLQSLEVSLKTEQELLKKNEELLTVTPQTINQMAALDEIQSRDNGYLILENIINPNYIAIETDIIKSKQTINSMMNSINVYKDYINELDAIKLIIDEYNRTGNYENTSSNIIEITDSSIYLPSQPVEPNQKTSPSNARNVIIGTFFGGMLGVLIVLFKWWWQNGEEEQKNINK